MYIKYKYISDNYGKTIKKSLFTITKNREKHKFVNYL